MTISKIETKIETCSVCGGPIDENDECRCEECKTCLGTGRVRDAETKELRRCLDCNGAGMHVNPYAKGVIHGR